MRNRIKTAIEFLKGGQSFNIDDIRLGLNEGGDIEVAGWSQYTNLENLTKDSSLRELDEIKYLFSEMIMSSPELRKFIQEKYIEYSLYYDDYGKASISICSEKNGVLKWKLPGPLLS